MTLIRFVAHKRQMVFNLDRINHVDYVKDYPIEPGCPVICTTLRIYYNEVPLVFHGDEAKAIWEALEPAIIATKLIPKRIKSESNT